MAAGRFSSFRRSEAQLGYLMLGIVTQHSWEGAKMGLWLIYLSRVIDGLSGGNISTAQAYIADVTTPQTRSHGMALLGVAFGVGFAAGPFTGRNFRRAPRILAGLHRGGFQRNCSAADLSQTS
jgi:DHA1 family tetracycline resistance protein-like MFS transporter